MPDTDPFGAPAPARAARPRQSTARDVQHAARAPHDVALRVAPLALWALVVSAVILALVLVAVGFAMGRATRVAVVECRCAP